MTSDGDLQFLVLVSLSPIAHLINSDLILAYLRGVLCASATAFILCSKEAPNLKSSNLDHQVLQDI